MGFYGFYFLLFGVMLRERDEESAVETLQRRGMRIDCRNEIIVFIGELTLLILLFT